ncbi:ATP-dependent Clp protease, protease subunit [Ruminococcaceae bacterium YRB3002]|nr:ATP-dependent Clp protease, protease subunit [Ruminococcaceae bacterium YRB3002]
MNYIPSIFENEGGRGVSYDIYSRLLKERIILLSDEVNNDTASTVIAQMLYLESVDPDKDIFLYINSPGGSVTAGMAIYDTMQYLKCDVNTVCIGLAASMGAFLLAGGTKGKRFALPNAEIMIHQILSSVSGQATDICLESEHLKKVKLRMNRILAENCGKTVRKITSDCERDNWKTADEARCYGLIDHVMRDRKEVSV